MLPRLQIRSSGELNKIRHIVDCRRNVCLMLTFSTHEQNFRMDAKMKQLTCECHLQCGVMCLSLFCGGGGPDGGEARRVCPGSHLRGCQTPQESDSRASAQPRPCTCAQGSQKSTPGTLAKRRRETTSGSGVHFHVDFLENLPPASTD